MPNTSKPNGAGKRDYFYAHEYRDYESFYRRMSDRSEISSDGDNPNTPDRVCRVYK